MWKSITLVLTIIFGTACTTKSIVVTSTPPGAEIYMFGRHYGKTPCSITVPEKILQKTDVMNLTAYSQQGSVVKRNVKIMSSQKNIGDMLTETLVAPVVLAGVIYWAEAGDHKPKSHYKSRSEYKKARRKARDDAKAKALVTGATVFSYAVAETALDLQKGVLTKQYLHIDFEDEAEGAEKE